MTILLVFVPIGALMIALGVTFLRGPVGPQLWFGGRIPRSNRQREAGQRANRIVGRSLLVGGSIVAVAAIAAWASGATLDDEFVSLMLVAAVMASILAGLVRALALVRAQPEPTRGRRGRGAKGTGSR